VHALLSDLDIQAWTAISAVAAVITALAALIYTSLMAAYVLIFHKLQRELNNFSRRSHQEERLISLSNQWNSELDPENETVG
jgi:hypothetical protein